MSKRVLKFTVQRKTWYRGKGADESRLCTLDGEKCCLGFLARALGYRHDRILNRGTPDDVFKNGDDGTKTRINKWPASLVEAMLMENGKTDYTNTELCSRLMNLNDDTSITEEYREKRLTVVFKEAGIQVQFKG